MRVRWRWKAASNRFDRYEASTLQTRYSSKEMAVYLLRDGEPITGKRCRRRRSCLNC
ncbi:MAG: hypothetical protein ACLUI3_08755 [Christensenellales bacterium]